MSPIEYIEKGIRKGDWEIVCEGYERLTGKALPPPKTTVTTSEAENTLRQIADIISSVPFKQITGITKKTKKKSGRPKNSGKKKVNITNEGEDPSILLDNTTQFITNEPDPEEVKKNKEKAYRANKNKVKINRQPARTYDVECNECEQIFQSNIKSEEIGQKCDNCLSQRKNRSQ